MRQPADGFLQTDTLFNFLLVEVELSLTFAKIAETTSAPSTRARNLDNARKGYATLCRYIEKRPLTDDQLRTLQPQLRRLEERLANAAGGKLRSKSFRAAQRMAVGRRP